MHDQDAVLARELDDPLEESLGHDRPGGVVRVVEVHQLRPSDHVPVDRLQIGREAVVGAQRHQPGSAPASHGPPV